jgi:hypothetical protein
MKRDDAAFADGCQAARADITAGRLVFRWTGHAGHWGHWIVMELFQRFKMTVDDGFGICFVDGFKVSFNDGYNEVMSAEIDRRFGAGAFQSVFVEAKSQSEERLGDAKHLWLQQKGK